MLVPFNEMRKKIHFWRETDVKFNCVFTSFPLSLWIFWGQGPCLFFFNLLIRLSWQIVGSNLFSCLNDVWIHMTRLCSVLLSLALARSLVVLNCVIGNLFFLMCLYRKLPTKYETLYMKLSSCGRRLWNDCNNFYIVVILFKSNGWLLKCEFLLLFIGKCAVHYNFIVLQISSSKTVPSWCGNHKYISVCAVTCTASWWAVFEFSY